MMIFKVGTLLEALAILAVAGTSVVYFGVLEGRFGWSVGKRVFRLRISSATTQQPPGVKRSLLRVSVFYLVPDLAILIVGLYLCIQHPEQVKMNSDGPKFSAEAEMARTDALLVSGAGVWYVLASIALFVTMRKRNGFRGLHEFASGTRTYRLQGPEYWRRRSLYIGQFDAPLLLPDGLPQKIGPYVIRGAFRWTGADRLLLAHDPQLGRAIWIWLRPPSEPALGETHRAVNRASRVRWLASGMYECAQWDAFLAPSGCPLPGLVRQNGRLSWAEFRPILEQLTDELVEACSDNSLPQSLSPEQVWLSPKGRVQLLETSYAAVCDPPTRPDATSDHRRAMALLADAATLALEGKPREIGNPARKIQAPLPLHARKLLDGLSLAEATPPDQPRYQRVNEFQADLKATAQQPMEVTPWACAKLLMGQGLYVLFCVPIVGMLLPFSDEPATGSVAWQIFAAVLIGAALVLAPAYLVRGGLGYYAAGIAIVLEDGRRAPRWRCLSRAVAAWGVVAILGLFVWWGVSYLTFVPWRNWTIPALAGALLCGYAYRMFRSPSRAPHDYLVGTCLVPK